jgi:hypothetical protein
MTEYAAWLKRRRRRMLLLVGGSGCLVILLWALFLEKDGHQKGRVSAYLRLYPRPNSLKPVFKLPNARVASSARAPAPEPARDFGDIG